MGVLVAGRVVTEEEDAYGTKAAMESDEESISATAADIAGGTADVRATGAESHKLPGMIGVAEKLEVVGDIVGEYVEKEVRLDGKSSSNLR